MQEPRVALIHDYLIQYGGAEKTLEEICKIFPEAPIYTSIYKPERLSEVLKSKIIIHSSNFLFQNFTKYLSFLMPFVFEHMDLSKFQIIISDSSAWAKGVLTNPKQLHISYIHTPPRFLYKYSVESTKRNAWYFKPIIPLLDSILRVWDFAAAQRPTYLVTNSIETQKRVKKFYNRDSVVIYPPVEVSKAKLTEIPIFKKDLPRNGFYLALGRLVAYKNFDLLIRVANKLDLPLVIAGIGPEFNSLRKLAKSHIVLLGQVTELQKSYLLENCLGLINPVQDEEFGIVPVEAMACGKPVLAHASGGSLETILPGLSGMFFEEIKEESLETALKIFRSNVEQKIYDADRIKESIQKFSTERFLEEFKTFVFDKWNKHSLHA